MAIEHTTGHRSGLDDAVASALVHPGPALVDIVTNVALV
jgi:hypothetical protein